MEIEDILIGLGAAFLLYAFIKGVMMKKIILSHWHHKFETPPFTSQEFYEAIKKLLEVKEMKHVHTASVNYSQGGLLSPNREYLRIKYNEFVFDICAAPFGTGYFVSWWLGEMGDALRDLLINLPTFGKLFNKEKKPFLKGILPLCLKRQLVIV